MPKGRLKKTAETNRIERVLAEAFPDYPPNLPPTAYRYNRASIRVRLVSDHFRGLDFVERGKIVYPVLKANLPEETWEDITVILLLTPEEMRDSPMNVEFENPAPARL